MKTKFCTKCKNEKLLDEFSLAKKVKNGRGSWCKSCCTLVGKFYRKKYPWKRTLIIIKQRCNNSKTLRYKDYGGRGIKCLITEDELKQLWLRDKAWLLNKPSIDRKNNDGNYCLENCQYIEMIENKIKDSCKAVNQYDLQGKFIKTWKSQSEIQRILGFAQGHISNVCSEKFKQRYGFIWNYDLKG